MKTLRSFRCANRAAWKGLVALAPLALLACEEDPSAPDSGSVSVSAAASSAVSPTQSASSAQSASAASQSAIASSAVPSVSQNIDAGSATDAATPAASDASSGAVSTSDASNSDAALPAIEAAAVTYYADDIELKGYLAAPAQGGPAPGILVVHEWWGHNAYVERRARMLAELGYVALAVDMYGAGAVTDDPQVAGQLAQTASSDADALKQKFVAARNFLANDPRVASGKIGAVGYCFGGGVILNMMRAGVPLDAVASFHGTLKTQQPLVNGTFDGRVLIEAGDADQSVPLTDVDAIRDELTNAGVTFDVHVYPGAKHAFTNPDATDIGIQYSLPIAYDAAADTQSWAALKGFLEQTWPVP